MAAVMFRGAALTLLAGLCAVGATAQIYTRVNERGVVEATDTPVNQSFQLTYPGKGTLIHSRGFRGVYNGEFDGHIRDAAASHGVSADLVRAVIQTESAYDDRAVSSKGARGLMQLMPGTARQLGVGNAFDPRQNVFGGTRYLRRLLDQFSGNLDYALAAYNAGPNAVLRYNGIPPYKETRRYVRKVRKLLGGGLIRTTAPSNSAIAFAPSSRLPRSRPGPREREFVPASPATYYRWTDPTGHSRVAQTPPPEGVRYTILRALP